jgi:protein phosphatase
VKRHQAEERMTIQAHAVTHSGKSRQSNEDSWLIDPELQLCVVSDGSTHLQGGACSDWVCKGIQRHIQENKRLLDAHHRTGSSADRQALLELVRQSIETVSAALYLETQTRSEMKGVIATACVALFSQGYAFIGHLGDSRAYSVKDGVFQLLTRDHTYLTALLAEGRTLEDARRVAYADNLSAAMGHQPLARASVQVRELARDERIMLCTDGISDFFGHSNFRAAEWAKLGITPLAEALRDYALGKNVRDNLTAITIEWHAQKQETPKPTKDVLTKLSTVSGIRLFQHFGEHSLMKLLSLSDTRELAQGEVLIRRGEILNEMFIVMSGELSIDLGKGPIQATVKKGEVVGEMSLFEGSLPSATLTALTPATVLTFHRDQLFQAMKEDIEFTARLELGLLQAVIRRLRERTETDDDAKNLKNYTVVSILPPETS